LQRQGAYVNALADSAFLTNVAALDPIWVNFSISQNQMARFQELAQKKLVVAPKDDNFDVELVMPNGTIFPRREEFPPALRRATTGWCRRLFAGGLRGLGHVNSKDRSHYLR